MISPHVTAEINKYKTFPRCHHLFPPYVEKHYFDNILVYHYDHRRWALCAIAQIQIVSTAISFTQMALDLNL